MQHEWIVTFRQERQGFEKRCHVTAARLLDAITNGAIMLGDAGYDAGDFEPIAVVRGSIAPTPAAELVTDAGQLTLAGAEHLLGRPADEDRCGGRNTLTRFADPDACTPGYESADEFAHGLGEVDAA